MLRKDPQKLIYRGQLVWSWLLIVNYRDLHLVKQSFTKFILICNLHMPYITYWILSVPKLSTIYIMYTSIYIYGDPKSFLVRPKTPFATTIDPVWGVGASAPWYGHALFIIYLIFFPFIYEKKIMFFTSHFHKIQWECCIYIEGIYDVLHWIEKIKINSI